MLLPTSKFNVDVSGMACFLFPQRLTYTEAVDILTREHKKSHKFEFEPKVSHIFHADPHPLLIQLI